MPAQILLDCDPGIDDALAIALAAGDADAELIGITTVAGNAELRDTTANALGVCELLGLHVPVVAGASRPLIRRLVTGGDVHGATGLGDVRLRAPTRAAHPGSAAEFIAATLRERPGEVTLVAVGPLTNLAMALVQHPEVAHLVRDVVIMGGAATVPGNVTPAAEFNIAVDPEAAAIVFDAGWTVTMVGLDATRRSRAGAADLERMRGFGRLSDELLMPCLEFWEKLPGAETAAAPAHLQGGRPSPAVHDACAVAHVLQPGLLDLRDARVDVETTGRFTYGMTVTDLAAEPRRWNARVALDLDAIALWDLMFVNYARLAASMSAD